MPLVDLAEPPSPSMRRWFGASLAAMLLVVAAGLVAQGWITTGMFVAGVALLELLVYYAVPASREPSIRTWRRATYPLGWIVGHALLMVVYFALVTPIGGVLRLLGYDPLCLRGDAADGGWRDRGGPAPLERYFRQF